MYFFEHSDVLGASLGDLQDDRQIRSTYGLVGYDVRLTRGRSPVRSWVGVLLGSLAQMVEHWSNKPRVMGSIPIGTIFVYSWLTKNEVLPGFEPGS